MIYKFSSHLEELRKMTESLPVLDMEYLIKEHQNNLLEYTSLISANITARGLFKIDEVAAMVGILDKGSVFPKHKHSVKECVICYKGRILFKWNDKSKELVAGNCICFNPNVPHSNLALEDSCFISITVPLDRGYPDV